MIGRVHHSTHIINALKIKLPHMPRLDFMLEQIIDLLKRPSLQLRHVKPTPQRPQCARTAEHEANFASQVCFVGVHHLLKSANLDQYKLSKSYLTRAGMAEDRAELAF
jgi:hypothetical protein